MVDALWAANAKRSLKASSHAVFARKAKGVDTIAARAAQASERAAAFPGDLFDGWYTAAALGLAAVRETLAARVCHARLE